MLKYKPRFQYIFLTVPRVQLNLNVASFPCRGRPGPVLDPIHNLQRQPTCKRLRRRQHEPTQKQIYPVSAGYHQSSMLHNLQTFSHVYERPYTYCDTPNVILLIMTKLTSQSASHIPGSPILISLPRTKSRVSGSSWLPGANNRWIS